MLYQSAAMHPKTPKPSQTLPILPTKAAINHTARLPRRSVTKPGVCGVLRHTLYRSKANACLPRDIIGKNWEGLRSIGKRAKPAAAGRRSAPAGNALGNAPACHTHTIAPVGGTINPLFPVISRYTPFCRHLSYCPRMRRIPAQLQLSLAHAAKNF